MSFYFSRFISLSTLVFQTKIFASSSLEKGIPAFGYGDYWLYFKNQDQPAVQKLDLQTVDQ